MGCACNQRKKKFEVVLDGGKVVFEHPIKSTADTVARRYPGSTVREQAPATVTARTPTAKTI
ncbi:hypothetical protein ACH4RG_23050 [Streptomyces sp. NPDC021019]|uniref:hypothetical protein n=1 Tax=Streptomyces sp. NPDC021019 TaxID=3365108 RepID=UPI0037ACCF4D